MAEAASQVTVIAEVIRLSVAPVFLLSGVGVMLTVLTNRLARTVDRARALEQREAGAGERELAELTSGLSTLAQRARLLSHSITLLTLCTLLICSVIVALFLGAFFEYHIERDVAVLFMLSMLCFIAAMLFFLREIYLATVTLRIGLRGRD